MYSSLEMVTDDITDLKEELIFKMQAVEPERLMEYCYTINESATESAKNVRNNVKTIFAKFMANVFDDHEDNMGSPLMIDLVVRNIFKYLPNTDLCSTRLVCRLWNSEANSYFRQNQRIIFYPESKEKIRTFTNYVKYAQEQQEELLNWASEKEKTIATTTTNGNDYRGPPFSTYCITAQYPRTQFLRCLMQDFINTCGRYIKKIEIFYPDDGYLSRSDFFHFFITGLPHLESIHIVNLPHSLTQGSFKPRRSKQHQHFDTICNYSNNDNNTKAQQCSSQEKFKETQQSAITHLRIDRTWQLETCWSLPFLQDLTSLMPNLQDYELWTWNSTTEDEHSQPYFKCLTKKNIEKLRTLRPGSIGDTLGLTIAELGLNLRKLYLPVLNRSVCASTIEAILESQRFTLEEFQLNCSTMQNSRLIVFPRMEALRHLHIIITYPWNNDYTTFTPSMDYNAKFPGLKILKMELAIYNDFGFIQYFFPNIVITTNNNNNNVASMQCNTLEELDLSFSGFRDDKFIGSLALLFPNVRRFRLDGYGSKIFSSIFLHMQKLQHLELYLIYGFNVDDQMIGMSKDVCAKLRKKEKFLSLENWELDEIKVYPSLCNLKDLQTLAIRQKDYQAKFWPDAQCITNITGYCALAHMKQLRHLHIESVKFTEECRDYLAQQMEDCWLQLD